MEFKKINVLVFFAVLISTVNFNLTYSQICSGTLGAPVFLEDFGSGSALYGPALPPGVTNYIYQTGPPPNGTYVISSNSNPSGINLGYVSDSDHTGNLNGYMMVINSDYPATEVYRKHVTGLCQNTTYMFSSWLSNNNTPSTPTTVCPGYVYANVKFQIEYPVSVIQNSITTGNLPLGLSNTDLNWKQYGFSFTTVSGQTSVDIVLTNNAPGGCGNDYVVDDISLSPCGPGVSLNIVPNQTIFCVEDSIELQSNFTSGNYSNPQYQWQNSSDGGVTWSNIAGATSSNYNISSVSYNQAGVYRLIIAENGNINLPSCSIIAGPLTFSVSNATLGVSSQTICSGSTTTLTATGASSYTWSTGAISSSLVVSPISTTSYSVMGSNGSCTNQAVSTVSVIPNSTISVTGNTLICGGQSTTLTASGSGSYTWNNGATTSSISVNPVNTTTYQVSIPGGSCSAIGTITVNVISSPTILITGNKGICSTQTTVLTASGADSYVWSTGAASSSISVNPGVTTSYSVVGSIGTCTNQAVTTVTINNPPTVLSLNFTNSACGLSTGSSTVSVSPSSCTYLWNNGSMSNISANLPAGIHTVTISNNGCNTQTFVTIASEPGPSITSALVNNTSCGLSNGSISLTSTPANNTYSWSPGISITTNTMGSLSPGSYTISAINGACQADTVVSVLSSIPLQILSSTIVASDCNISNGSITVTDNGVNSTYNWSPGIALTSNSISNLSNGSYSLNISDGACSTTSVFIVPLLSGPTGLYVIQKNAICLSQNGSLNVVSVVNGLPPFQYNFNNNGFSAVSTFSNLSQGMYSISVMDANSCTYTESYTISVSQTTVTIKQIIKSTSCESDDGEIRIGGIKGGSAPYLLSFNQTSFKPDTSFSSLWAGTYSLNILDSNKCVTGFSIIVPENGEDYSLYVPNTFTPNTDIVNDVWYVQGTCLGDFKCEIFNRWGEKIIELNDIKEGWDGKYKEKEVPEGIYVYKIKVKTKTETVNKSGHIIVYR